MRYNKECQAAGGRRVWVLGWCVGNVVYEVVVVSVGELLRSVMIDLWKDERGERGGRVCARRGVLCEDGGVVGNAGAVCC